MGWISSALGQIAITSLALGALKRHNVIQLQPANIKNDTLRVILVQAVYLGEEATIMTEKLMASVQEEMSSGASKRK